MPDTLETIIDKIIAHDRDHPDHGIGCACHDQHAWAIRRLFSEKGIDTPETYKSRANLRVVLGYVCR